MAVQTMQPVTVRNMQQVTPMLPSGLGGTNTQVELPDSVPPEGCSCLKENGSKSLVWKYVGQNQGSFKPEQSYEYVGQGQGTHDKEIVVTPGKFSSSKVCMCLGLSCCLLLPLVALLTILGLWAAFSHPSNPGGKVAVIRYDCQAGRNNWAKGWSEAKKDWCCAREGVGCVPETKGCLTNCEYMSKTASCAYRIQWGANHRFLHQPQACMRAHQMVLGQCPFCNACPLAQAGCKETPATTKAPAVPAFHRAPPARPAALAAPSAAAVPAAPGPPARPAALAAPAAPAVPAVAVPARPAAPAVAAPARPAAPAV
eukprot:CAMPEP_0172864762 /NCGR_PEP_ID=MMETSP1075-20121228/81022_1 /TAXON_ID=2916 /ORGANISM="Ceratium fusus, Strain PA161109" /LENGTH=312 /DNA_ID=CAMNT_0013713719 /DNA_START=72 /DNA_END=1006 /DNA_ORIENTATION=-